MAVPRVGLITIGQAPRDDVVPEMLAQLGFEVEAIQLGAIDGLSLEEVRELAPRGDEPWAVSRLRDGTEVRLAKRELDPRMQRCVAALGGAVYFLYPQLANVGGVVERTQHANPIWIAAAVACSVLTYIGATISMIGAIPRPLRLGPTFAAQLASSFTNRITPASAGGYAVNIQFDRFGKIIDYQPNCACCTNQGCSSECR